MYDAVIVGKGPAGISASLYIARANLKVLVIGKNDSLLSRAGKIENYFGFSAPISGSYLLEEGEKQALRLGVEILVDEVIGIEKNNLFEVLTSKAKYTCKTVLLATGQPPRKVNIKNLPRFEGKGVSYCTTCDGFLYNNLKVGVLGYGDYAIHEALELKPHTDYITIYTNGQELELTDSYAKHAARFKVNTKPVMMLDGNEFLERIYLSDGTSEEIDGLFVAYGSASSVDFARKLGVVLKDDSVVVDSWQRTNLDGLFAAGDCTGGFKQIATAVGEGALAGKMMIDYVRGL